MRESRAARQEWTEAKIVGSVASKAVPWGEISLREKLGKGAFGEVYACDYAHTR